MAVYYSHLSEHMDRAHIVVQAHMKSQKVFSCFQFLSIGQQNKLLEAEIKANQNRFQKPTASYMRNS